MDAHCSHVFFQMKITNVEEKCRYGDIGVYHFFSFGLNLTVNNFLFMLNHNMYTEKVKQEYPFEHYNSRRFARDFLSMNGIVSRK